MTRLRAFVPLATVTLLSAGCAASLGETTRNEAVGSAVCSATEADRKEHASALVGLGEAVVGGISSDKVTVATFEVIMTGDVVLAKIAAGCGEGER